MIYQYYSPSGLKKTKNLSNSSKLVIKEAEKHGLTWRILPGTPMIGLTYQGEERFYYYQVPCSTTALAKYITVHKAMVCNLLRAHNISVPCGYKIRRNHDKKYILKVYKALEKPVVVKPTNGTWGENITINISDPDSYLKAVDLALSYSKKSSSGAIVEEMFKGEEYRILLTRDKVIAVSQRIPANVIGNGKDSIKKLIQKKNKQDIRGIKGSEKSHLKIRMDKRLRLYLHEQGLELNTVLKQGKRVFLRRVSNISQGGDAIDMTDQVHPSVKNIALKAIKTIPGLTFAGIDFMSKDITQKQTEDSYVILEINDSPGFDIHDLPYQGKNRHAAREFLYLIFPELRK